MRILLIEDELKLARHIRSAFLREGHEIEVQNDGALGLRAALNTPPDLIILDLNLPTIDGLEILRQLRATRHPARILILTARGEVSERIKGLRTGADDYLAKPFSIEELIARVEALGRRNTADPAASTRIQLADLHLDLANHRVTRSGQMITLSPREFDLLSVLAREPGRVFSRTELCERIWQRDHAYDTRTVEIFVARLRKKIDAPFPSPLLHTLRHVGYTLSLQPPES